MIGDPLVALPMRDAVAAMQAGEFDVRDYVKAHLDRLVESEPTIQAWNHIDCSGAMAAAEQLSRLSPEERMAKPLLGIPVGVKDVIDVQGQPTTADFGPYSTRIVARDAAIVARLRAAGAVIVGKTTTAQFAWGQDAPKTRNPRHLAHTPGASSTGTPAAVAAGQVPLAIGTQTTSSLLRPSAYCGVVGLKPSFGRISCTGIIPTSWTSDHPGFSARRVADVALALHLTAGHDPADPRTGHAPIPSSSVKALTTPPRFGLILDLLERASGEVRSGFEEAIAALAAAGAEIVPIRLPVDYDLILSVHWASQVPEAAAIHTEQFARMPEAYLPTVQQNFEIASLVPAVALVQARRLRRRIAPQLLETIAGFDALIAPTSSDMPPRIDTLATKSRLGDPSFQVMATAFGYPALSLPTGMSDAGLPYAMQFITGPMQEEAIFRAAGWAETVLPPLPIADMFA